MSYTDLQDFAPEYVTQRLDGTVTVEIEKLGGGSPGKTYAGTWRYRVTWPNGDVIAQGQDLSTGTPKTHAEAADILVGFLDVNDA